MLGMLITSLVCASLIIMSARAAIRRIASHRRIQLAQIIVILIFVFGAVAAPLMLAPAALAAPSVKPDLSLPLTCSTYYPVPRNAFEIEMAAGARDRVVGDWGHTYRSIISYDNAYNMAYEDDSLREKAAMNMACEFLYKANLEDQLLQARKYPALALSSKMPTPPDDIAALSIRDIAAFKDADCDIAVQLVSFAVYPELAAWAESHGCSSSALSGAVLPTATPLISGGPVAAAPASATITIRDVLGEINGIEEIVWLKVGNQKQIIYLRDGYQPVQLVRFTLPAARGYSFALKEKTFFVAPATTPDRFANGTLLADGTTYNLEVNGNRGLNATLRPYLR